MLNRNFNITVLTDSYCTPQEKQYFTEQLNNINTELITIIAQIATYKTLKFLLSNNATTDTTTETDNNGQTTTYGFDMAFNLLKTLPQDIKILSNQMLEETVTDAIDLVQVATVEIIPYLTSMIQFNLNDTIYTKTLKNGNEKNYTLFALACKGIRKYITDQQQTRQYKKQSYILGYTDNGTEILTTKRPKNDISEITSNDKLKFLRQYNLTELEQKALYYKLNGLTTEQIAQHNNVSKRTIERLLKSAKEKIKAIDKRIKL